MSIPNHRFLINDSVKYVGERSRSLGSKNNAWGTVCGYVKGQPTHLVVDFGSDTYVLDEADLAPYHFTEPTKGPDIIKISRKWDSE